MITTTDKTVTAFNDVVETQVTIAGSGPPVVFSHGAGGLTWDPFLDDLAGRFKVYAPAHPGTGGDPDAVRNIRGLWELVLYYYELFDKLGLRSPAIVGYSFGGMVAAEVAATNPERVSKLVLLSSIGLWRDDHPVRDWMALPPEEAAKLSFYDSEGPLAKEMMAMPEAPEEITGHDYQAYLGAGLHRRVCLAYTGQGIESASSQGDGTYSAHLGQAGRHSASGLR